jgi:hypothetical protein
VIGRTGLSSPNYVKPDGFARRDEPFLVGRETCHPASRGINKNRPNWHAANGLRLMRRRSGSAWYLPGSKQEVPGYARGVSDQCCLTGITPEDVLMLGGGISLIRWTGRQSATGRFRGRRRVLARGRPTSGSSPPRAPPDSSRGDYPARSS